MVIVDLLDMVLDLHDFYPAGNRLSKRLSMSATDGQ